MKPINNNWDEYKDLYSFDVNELMELEKYLKSKIYWQDKVIEQYISYFLLYTYRNEENSNWIGPIFNFGPTGSWKNFILKLIAERLGFWFYCLSMDQWNYCEISTILGASDWYSSNSESILEWIYNISKQFDWKLILVIDEAEKWGVSSDTNWNFSWFLTSLMNILDSRIIYTKNTNAKLDLANFLIVFNSNLGYDEFDEKLTNNHNKIWFDIWDNKTVIKEEKVVDDKYIENYLKHTLKVQKSVFARLRKGDNFIFFNHLDKTVFKNYLDKKYNELIIDITDNFEVKWKLPTLSIFKKEIDSFDYNKWFRWINNLVNLDIKILLLKKYVFKKYFNKNLKVWM